MLHVSHSCFTKTSDIKYEMVLKFLCIDAFVHLWQQNVVPCVYSELFVCKQNARFSRLEPKRIIGHLLTRHTHDHSSKPKQSTIKSFSSIFVQFVQPNFCIWFVISLRQSASYANKDVLLCRSKYIFIAYFAPQ